LHDPPYLQGIVIKTENLLKVRMFVLSTTIPKSAYSHLVNGDKLKTTSKLSNVLAFCTPLFDKCDVSFNPKKYIFLAISFLETYCRQTWMKMDLPVLMKILIYP